MNKALAEKAAKWWAERLRKSPTFDCAIPNSPLEALLIIDSEARPQHFEHEIRLFEISLVEALEADESPYLTIGSDYGPDTILVTAALAGGFVLGATDLPWKTFMWVDDRNKLYVREGYNGQTIELGEEDEMST